MAIDTSMYSMLKPVDFAGSVEKGMSLRDMADQRMQRQRAQQEQEQLKAAYQAGVVTGPDGSASIDKNRTMSALAKVNPQEAQKFQGQQIQMDSASMEKKIKEMDLLTRSLGSVNDPQGWENWKVDMQRSGVDMAKFQDTPYDPAFKERLLGMTLTAKDRLDQQFKEREFGLKEREVKAKEVEAGTKRATEGGKMTEAQSKSLGFGRRAMLADQLLEQVQSDPNFDVSSIKTQARMALPKWMGGIKDPREQALTTSKLGFIASVLRKESGAAVTPEEFETYSKIYFPQPGDDAQSQMDKKTMRQNFIDTERLTAGSAWKDPIPLQRAAKKTLAPASGAAPVLKTSQIEWAD